VCDTDRARQRSRLGIFYQLTRRFEMVFLIDGTDIAEAAAE
jgi:hypothetical protein